MAVDATIQIGKTRFRFTAPGLNVLRIQAVGSRKRFTEDSWSVVSRDLGDPNFESANTDEAVLFGTEDLLAAFRLIDAELAVMDADGNAVMSLCEMTVDKSGSAFEIPSESQDLVLGLGQGTGALNRRDTRKEIWNIDVLGHASCIHPSLQNLYQSIPFAIFLREGRACGVFWDDAGRQSWDFRGSKMRVSGKSNGLDLYLFGGPTLAAVLDDFTGLTGRMAMPPRWGLGYQQSRYSYRSREELEEIAREFREREIPCDVLYLDIDCMEEYRVFSFGRSFPKPKEMLAGLRDSGFKISAIVDPGVKDDPKFPVLKRGKSKKAFVRKKGGGRISSARSGPVTPGSRTSRIPMSVNGGPANRAGFSELDWPESGMT